MPYTKEQLEHMANQGRREDARPSRLEPGAAKLGVEEASLYTKSGQGFAAGNGIGHCTKFGPVYSEEGAKEFKTLCVFLRRNYPAHFPAGERITVVSIMDLIRALEGCRVNEPSKEQATAAEMLALQRKIENTDLSRALDVHDPGALRRSLADVAPTAVMSPISDDDLPKPNLSEGINLRPSKPMERTSNEDKDMSVSPDGGTVFGDGGSAG